MAADTIGVDQLQNVGLFFSLLARAVAAEKRGIVILSPSKRRIVDLEVVEDLVIKSVLAGKEFMDLCEEQTAFGALNYAMIISTCDRDRFAYAELRESGGRHCL